MRVAKSMPLVQQIQQSHDQRKDHGFMIAYYSITGVTGALE